MMIAQFPLIQQNQEELSKRMLSLSIEMQYQLEKATKSLLVESEAKSLLQALLLLVSASTQK